MDVPYGDIFRLRYGDVDLPANGGPDLLGTQEGTVPMLRFRKISRCFTRTSPRGRESLSKAFAPNWIT